MKPIITKTLALTAASLSLITAANAQVYTDPVGMAAFWQTGDWDGNCIARSLVARAEANGFSGSDSFTYRFVGGWDTYGILAAMIADLLVNEENGVSYDWIVQPADDLAPNTEAEFFSFCSSAARELILELIHVQQTGTSNYFSRSTLRRVRQPEINDALVRLLVRSLR